MQVTKTILAAAIGLGISAGAFADAPSGSVNGVAVSAVSGSNFSGSVVGNGGPAFQSASHGSFAASTNRTEVSGVALPGTTSAALITHAETEGSTITGAGGVGLGGAVSAAYQSGYGSIRADVLDTHGATVYAGHVDSQAATFTGSSATVLDTGFAISGSNGEAENTTGLLLTSGTVFNGVYTIALGGTAGDDKVSKWGFASAGDSVNGGGQSAEWGNYNGVISRGTSSANAPTINVTPPQNQNHANNGWGNGDQAAPGKSLTHNNAENAQP